MLSSAPAHRRNAKGTCERWGRREKQHTTVGSACQWPQYSDVLYAIAHESPAEVGQRERKSFQCDAGRCTQRCGPAILSCGLDASDFLTLNGQS